MLRGAQKQMIVIRTHDSRLFEEAYFGRAQAAHGTSGVQGGYAVGGEPHHRAQSRRRGAGRGHGYRHSPRRRRRAHRRGREHRRAQTTCRRHLPFLRRQGIVRGLWFLLGVLCGGGAVSLLHLLP